MADEGDADCLDDDGREVGERLSVKGGRDGSHQRSGEAGQRSEAGLRMGMVPRLGRLGVGVRVYDPSAVHVVRMVEKRRRRRVPDEEDTQPAGQSSSYFFSAMHAQCVWMKYALPIKERLRRATADARRPRPRWKEHTLVCDRTPNLSKRERSRCAAMRSLFRAQRNVSNINSPIPCNG